MRTVSELQDALDEDLSWRRAELHSFLGSIRRSKSDSTAQVALCRAGVPLLYAHWEGYAKAALTNYLRFVGRRKLTYSELHFGFISMAVEHALEKEKGASSTQRNLQRVTTLLTADSERASLPWRKGVDTQSNLNSDRCFDLFTMFGLDPEPIRLKSKMIDYELLRVRNEVAHGKYLSVTPEAYKELHDKTLEMIEFIKNSISTAAENGDYRRIR
ncbi:MAE_28990/MAE_18760 family HEPN-like nuclease [Nocardiopsis quinghaiensis]|uniref:MAE_28990/MAE_18760 family HEPN-like nuclease n=1 Tax=Nocardiopsis quinghaiensis TaxID=464995 RepID=UPI001680865B|nr:MAE_28990/MAE_18760 family HEPN-like nuclease [Nocardiopsis quinghaiensis]